MRQIAKRALLILTCTTLLSFKTFASIEIDGIFYNIKSIGVYTAEVTDNPNKYSGNIVIPSTIIYEGKEYEIIRIGTGAFYECSNLTSITLPNNVTDIGNYAFKNCTGLTTFIIPDNVVTIGNQAFYGCTNLSSVYIGNRVNSIEDYAFKECTNLTAVHITDIKAWCKINFRGDSNPLSYAHHLYQNGEEIIDLIIPEGLTYINDLVFEKCYSLASVTIPNSVTRIGRSAFYNCSNLTSISISNNLQEISSSNFEGCTNLTTITIPNSVSKIGSRAFKGCTNLSSITLNNGLKTIGEEAFKDCSNLKSLRIPSTVSSIENYIIHYCPNLTSIIVESGNTVYDSRDNCNAIIETKTNKITHGCAGSFIPSTVTTIGKCAFEVCQNLTSITIPSNVKTIECYAFNGCTNLNNIVIDNGVNTIGYNAFQYTAIKSITIPSSVRIFEKSWGDINNIFNGCPNLASIIVDEENTFYDSRENCNAIIEKSTNTIIYGCTNTIIPNSVTSIGSGAFSGSGLMAITIPNSINSIGRFAFEDCNELCNVKVCHETPLAISVNEPYFNASQITLFVPKGSKTAYETTAPWKDFKEIIEFDPTYIEQITSNENCDAQIFTIDGKMPNKPKKGLNIVRMKDGTFKKVVVK